MLLVKKICTHRQYQIAALLLLMTAFDILLLLFRMHKSDFNWAILRYSSDIAAIRGVNSFLFLVWNLFLAWIPYLLSWGLPSASFSLFNRFKSGIILLLWLLFLPNAPYILTDLLHVKYRFVVPLWYDVMLIFSFGFTGLMLGWVSIQRVQSWLQRWLTTWQVWSFIYAALALCGYGVFIGRFQRWNSWDIIANPLELLQDIKEVLLNPVHHLETFGLSIVLGVFLILGYLLLHVISQPLILNLSDKTPHKPE